MAEKILNKIAFTDKDNIKWWGYTFPGFQVSEPTQKTSVIGSSKLAARGDHSHRTGQLIETSDFLFMKNAERTKLGTYPTTYAQVQQYVTDQILGGTYKGTVNFYADLPTSGLKDGDIYGVLKDTAGGKPSGDYRYHNQTEHPTDPPIATGWYLVSSNRVPLASADYNGLLTSTDFSYIQNIKGTSFQGLIPQGSTVVTGLGGITGTSNLAARADHLHDSRYLMLGGSAQTVTKDVTFSKTITIGAWGTSDIRDTSGNSLLGVDATYTYLAKQAGTTLIRSGATDLIHRKNGTDYKLLDASNILALTIQLNGTAQPTYNGLTARTINITPGGIGTYTKTEIDKKVSDVNTNIGSNYLPLSAGSNKKLTDSLYLGTNKHIYADLTAGNPKHLIGILANGIIQVGSSDQPLSLYTNTEDIFHSKNSGSYKIWDAYNLSNPATTTDLNNYLPLSAGPSKPLTNDLYLNTRNVNIKATSSSHWAYGYNFKSNDDTIRLGGFGMYADASNVKLLFIGTGNYNDTVKNLRIYPDGKVSVGNDFTSDGNIYVRDKRFSFGNDYTTSPSIGANNDRIAFYLNKDAVGINTGNILVSNIWADADKVPTNGIYSKGVIHSAAGFYMQSSRIANLNLTRNASMISRWDSFSTSTTNRPGADTSGVTVNDGFVNTLFWDKDFGFQIAYDVDGSGIAYRGYTPSTGANKTGWKFLADTAWVKRNYYPNTGRGFLSIDTNNGRPIMNNNQGYACKLSDGTVKEVLWIGADNKVNIGTPDNNKEIIIRGTLKTSGSINYLYNNYSKPNFKDSININIDGVEGGWAKVFDIRSSNTVYGTFGTFGGTNPDGTHHVNYTYIGAGSGIAYNAVNNLKVYSDRVTFNDKNLAFDEKFNSYLPLTGGTLTGPIRIDSLADAKISLVSTDNDKYSLIGFYDKNINLLAKFGWMGTFLGVTKNGTNYEIWDKLNLSDPAKLSANQTFTGSNTFASIIKANTGIRIGNVDDIGWYFGSANRITAGANIARGVNVGSLLVSNSWGDHTNVPTNGIYSKGTIKTSDYVDALGLIDNSGTLSGWTETLTPNKNFNSYLRILDKNSDNDGPTSYATVLRLNSRKNHWSTDLYIDQTNNNTAAGKIRYRTSAFNTTVYSPFKILATEDWVAGQITGKYLPLTGGTISGTSITPLLINSTNTESTVLFQKNGTNKARFGYDINPFMYSYAKNKYLYIDETADNIKYGTNASNYVLAKCVSVGVYGNNFIYNGNEFNFVPDNFRGDLWLNYRGISVGNAIINNYIFGNGSGSGFAFLKAAGYKTPDGTASQFLKADGSVDSNSYALSSHTHAWSSITGKPSTFAPSVHTHESIVGKYTGSGGVQGPNYMGANAVRFNMMYANPPGNSSDGDTKYCDWILMNCYSWSDVPYATAIGVSKKTSNPRAWIMCGPNNSDRTTWSRKELACKTDIPTSLKCPHALTIQQNGTTLGTYDGSAAKTVNITATSVSLTKASVMAALNTAGTNTFTQYCDFTAGAGNSGSDMRFKKDIKYIGNILDDLMNIKIFSYIWNKRNEKKYDTIGVSAEQLKENKLFEKLVHERPDKDKTQFVDYDRIGVLALKGLQELNNQITEELKTVKKENKKLTERVDKLEKILRLVGDRIGVEIDL